MDAQVALMVHTYLQVREPYQIDSDTDDKAVRQSIGAPARSEASEASTVIFQGQSSQNTHETAHKSGVHMSALKRIPGGNVTEDIAEMMVSPLSCELSCLQTCC